jgi:hypothetical protein
MPKEINPALDVDAVSKKNQPQAFTGYYVGNGAFFAGWPPE